MIDETFVVYGRPNFIKGRKRRLLKDIPTSLQFVVTREDDSEEVWFIHLVGEAAEKCFVFMEGEHLLVSGKFSTSKDEGDIWVNDVKVHVEAEMIRLSNLKLADTTISETI